MARSRCPKLAEGLGSAEGRPSCPWHEHAEAWVWLTAGRWAASGRGAGETRVLGWVPRSPGLRIVTSFHIPPDGVVEVSVEGRVGNGVGDFWGGGLGRKRQSYPSHKGSHQMFTNIDGARTSCQVQRILQATTPTLTGEETEAQEDQGTCLHSLSPRW